MHEGRGICPGPFAVDPRRVEERLREPGYRYKKAEPKEGYLQRPTATTLDVDGDGRTRCT